MIYNDEPQTWEFYDLENDPNEENNIYVENSKVIVSLKKLLLKHFKENNIKTKLINPR